MIRDSAAVIASLPAFLAILTAGLVTLVGALGRAADKEAIVGHRARLVISEAPRDAEQVLTVFKRLAADEKRPDAAPNRNVVLVGQIGGMPNIWPDTHPHFPWYPGQASFFLVDSKVAKQFAEHAKHHGGNDNCVFCRQLAAKNVHAIAVVNLVDEQGKTLPIDLRKIVDLKEKQTVIVRGKAKLLAGSLLQIDADGVYVDQPATATRSAQNASR